MCDCKQSEPKWKSEYQCREIFEKLFTGYKFKKERPYFLERLELDGYCQQLLLAFEFDGIQHFEHLKYFHKTYTQFEEQKIRDKKKDKLCKEHGVKLVRIPYNYSNYGFTLELFIVKSLENLGFKFQVIQVLQYRAIVSAPQKQISFVQKRIEINKALCELLDLRMKNCRIRTTREKIMSNSKLIDEKIPEIREAFNLKSQSKPKTITGYLSFINSVFKVSGRSLVAIEPGVYEFQSLLR